DFDLIANEERKNKSMKEAIIQAFSGYKFQQAFAEIDSAWQEVKHTGQKAKVANLEYLEYIVKKYKLPEYFDRHNAQIIKSNAIAAKKQQSNTDTILK
ncbi:MAG: hypothetical protein IJ529_03525, partial [Alphaproteobacteria bacterium]|nr:hypothetical protein [Alphaproteobacteria bacterium]